MADGGWRMAETDRESEGALFCYPPSALRHLHLIPSIATTIATSAAAPIATVFFER